jgi:cell division protein FtsI/penicillin-binding protein 2
VGAAALHEAAQLFNIETAAPNTVKALQEHLTQAAFGQGEVLVTPLRMTRVAAAIANNGALVPVRMHVVEGETVERQPVVPAALARELAQAMRGVVTHGTGTAAKGAIAIAGKTGTAEAPKPPSHAWFTGFAPYGAPPERQVAFTILVEHGRYGGRAAAPFAPEIARLAQSLKLIDGEGK